MTGHTCNCSSLVRPIRPRHSRRSAGSDTPPWPAILAPISASRKASAESAFTPPYQSPSHGLAGPYTRTLPAYCRVIRSFRACHTAAGQCRTAYSTDASQPCHIHAKDMHQNTAGILQHTVAMLLGTGHPTPQHIALKIDPANCPGGCSCCQASPKAGSCAAAWSHCDKKWDPRSHICPTLCPPMCEQRNALTLS
jgi:hypothetical protein